MNFDIGVIGVGLAGQQRLDLAGMGLLPKLLQRGLGLGDDALVALLLAEGCQRDMVIERAMRSKLPSDVSSCWRSRIRLWARRESFQKSGASASRSSAASRALARSGSKMPPEQGQGLSDVVDDRLGFGAHRFL